jgi:hypothetical protein
MNFKFLILILSIIVFNLILVGNNLALSQNNHAENAYGLNTTAEHIPAFGNQVNQQQDNFLQTRTGQIVGFILSFVGVLFLILMIYAGLIWMTAGGNQEQVKKARSLMINAVLGLIVVMGAYAITAFIGQHLID